MLKISQYGYCVNCRYQYYGNSAYPAIAARAHQLLKPDCLPSIPLERFLVESSLTGFTGRHWGLLPGFWKAGFSSRFPPAVGAIAFMDYAAEWVDTSSEIVPRTRLLLEMNNDGLQLCCLWMLFFHHCDIGMYG